MLSILLASAVVFTPENSEVVIASDAPKTVLFAAEEATNFLSRVFGAPVPIVTSPSAGKASLVLGDNVHSRAAGIDVAKLPRDGFVLRTHGDHVYAAGRDSETADPRRCIRNGSLGGGIRFERATLFAVYEFLERFAGCRFFFPGDCGEVTPRQVSFTVSDTDLTRAPYFTSRDPYMGGDGVWYDDGPPGSERPQSGKVLHWLRLRMDTESVPCCHGQQWNMIRERFAATHPQYFQMRRDSSRCTGTPKPGQKAHDFNQLCQSSDVWDVFYEDAKAYLTGKSAESRGIPSRYNALKSAWNQNFTNGKYVDVMPQDAFHECFCSSCQKAYDKSSPHYATDLVWGQTAKLARRLKEDGINAVVSQMSYLPYGSVPSFALPDNILVTVAQPGPWSVRNRAKFDGQIALFKAWYEKTNRRIRTWTYAHKYGRTRIPGVPVPAPRAYGRFWKAAAPYVCGGFLETEADRSIQQYFNYYVFSKIAWNPDLDVEALIADHHEKMFGAGAQAMAEFYAILEDKWIGEIAGNIKETSLGPVAVVPSEYDIWTKVYSPAVIRSLGALCDRAAAAVKAGSPEAKRIAFIRQQYLDPLKETSAVYMESISVERGLKERAQRPERSILANGGFEGLAGWEPGEEGTVAFDEKVKVTGRGSVRLTARKKAEARQYLGNDFKPNEKYRVSFFLKTENIRPLVDGKGGVYVEVYDGQWQFFPTKGAYCGTMDWIFQEWEFTASEAKAHERLFFHVLLNGVEGTAWFDDIRVEKVEP